MVITLARAIQLNHLRRNLYPQRRPRQRNRYSALALRTYRYRRAARFPASQRRAIAAVATAYNRERNNYNR